VTPSVHGVEVHRDVETVHQGDVVEVQVAELVQGELRQGVRRNAPALAVQAAGAVTCLAPPSPTAVEVAPGATPYAGHGSARVHPQVPRLPAVQAPPAAGAGSRPHRVGAVVDDLEVCSGGER